ncbi:MAG: hypothetical protein BWY46_00793 [Firmicutes bacterium ADurb.Bin300]|jgi:hypothetical protein|nr:MAG: hypothetical protein BWY46_00793 [Firmicutes bacterium ADurb.Bin300]
MAELLNKVREHYKSLTPLSSTLIKFYIPVLTVLVIASAAVGLIYLFTDSTTHYNLVLDCVVALKSTFGLSVLSFIVARAVRYNQ